MFRGVPLIVRRGRTQPLGLIQNSHKVQLRVVEIKRVQRVTNLPFRRRVQGGPPPSLPTSGWPQLGLVPPALRGP